MLQTKGSDPITHIEALVKSNLITKKQLVALAEHAKANGINDTNPMRQLDGLIKLNAIDPSIGELMLTVNKQAGFARFYDTNPNIDHRTIDISRISEAKQALSRWYTSPSYVADRHPSAEMFSTGIIEAQISEARLFENAVLVPQAEILDHYGLTGWEGLKTAFRSMTTGKTGPEVKGVREILAARDLLDEFPTWEAAVAAKSNIRKAAEFAFRRLRAMTDELRLYTIQSSLRQGRGVARFGDLDEAKQALLARTFKVAPEDVSPDLMVVDNSIHAKARRSKEEVEEFVELMRQFKTSADIPAEAKATVPDWMIEEFDLWQNFGIDSYWPYIHRGKVIVEKILPSGTVETVAWARSGMEGIDMVRKLVKDGVIDATTELTLRPVGYTMDDVLMQLIDSDQHSKVINLLMKQAGIERVQAADILSGVGLKPVSSRLQQPHLEKRQANLRGVFDNPLEEMMIYGARVMRNRYLLDIDDAFSWMKSNHYEVSKAFNLKNLDELPNITSYLDDLWATAKGEPSSIEQFLDLFLNTADFVFAMPKQTFRLFNERGIDGVLDPKIRELYLARGLFETPSRTRQFSGSIASAHSFFKLGVTPMAPLVNLSQLGINTYPVLGDVYFRKGLRGFHDLFMGNLDEVVAADYKALLDQIGVKWQRSVAGARAGLPLPTAPAPGQSALFKKMLSLQRPMIHSGGNVANIGEMVNHIGMYFFEGVETYNRSTTAIGAYLRGLASTADGGLGLSKLASIEYARQVVANTQFLYFDTALPKILRGPAAKVLAQFKPYMFNQIRFEKNMMVGMAKGDAEAAKVFARHTAAIFALGGTRAIAKHPILGAIAGVAGFTQRDRIFGLFTEPKDLAESYFDAQHDPEGKPDLFRARDLINHGLPGLIGLSVANRVGISATDLQFFNNGWGMVTGPQGSLVADFFKFGASIAGQGDEGTKQVGIDLFAMAAVKSAFQARGVRLPPFTLIASALAANEVQSNFSDNPGLRSRALFPNLDPTIRSANVEANRIRQSISPKVVNDMLRSFEIFQGSLYYDTSGRPILVPMTGAAHVSAIMTAAAGGQSTFDADRSAYEQMLLTLDQKRRSLRASTVEGITIAIATGNWDEYLKLRALAEQEGMSITDESVNEGLSARLRDRSRSVERRILPESVK